MMMMMMIPKTQLTSERCNPNKFLGTPLSIIVSITAFVQRMPTK